MSNYGADANPDLGKAFDLQITKGFISHDKTNVMQWTYEDRTVVKLANRKDKTNILFKIKNP